MLVEYLYGKDKRYKQLLWFCYGQYIVNNLEKNIEVKKTKLIQCIDCEEWFEIDIKDTKACRCSTCQHEYRKEYQRELMRKRKNLAQQEN